MKNLSGVATRNVKFLSSKQNKIEEHRRKKSGKKLEEK